MLYVFRAFQLQEGQRETAPPGFSLVDGDETRKNLYSFIQLLFSLSPHHPS